MPSLREQHAAAEPPPIIFEISDRAVLAGAVDHAAVFSGVPRTSGGPADFAARASLTAPGLFPRLQTAPAPARRATGVIAKETRAIGATKAGGAVMSRIESIGAGVGTVGGGAIIASVLVPAGYAPIGFLVGALAGVVVALVRAKQLSAPDARRG